MRFQSSLRHLDAAQIRVVRHLCQQHDKRCGRTHDNRIHKHAQHLNQALRCRVLHVGRSGGIRRGTLAGFVGEQAAFDAEHHALRNQTAQQAAAGRFERERVFKNQADYAWNFAEVGGNHIQRHADIHQRHHRHNRFGHASHTFNAAENNRSGSNHQNRRNAVFVVVPHFFGHAVHRGHARRRLDSLHNRVGLNRVIHEAEAENQADRKQDGQPALVQAVGNIIRRAAAEQAGFLVAHFINLRQGGFGKGGTHADQRRYPHPKHGTRAAGRNG